MERQLIRGNLERIVKIAEAMHLPGSAERIHDLAQNALHMLDRTDRESMELGLIVAAMAKAQRDSLAGPKTIPAELTLSRWALREAQRRFPDATA